jgi:molybdopterin-guanine dinucleotide biosynthesis protein
VLLTSDQRWVLMHELRGGREPTLEEQIKLLSPCDLALVEGYKTNDLIPKLEVYRPAHRQAADPSRAPEHRRRGQRRAGRDRAAGARHQRPGAIVQFIVNWT